MVLTTPLFAYLARSGPVDVLCTPTAGPLLENHPAVRRVILYDKRGADRGLHGFLGMAARLKQRGVRRRVFRAGFCAQWRPCDWPPEFASASGFASSAGRRFYTTRIQSIENTASRRATAFAWDTQSAAERASRGAAAATLPGRSRAPRRRCTARATSAIVRCFALAPGSVWATKRWPYYAEFGTFASARHDSGRDRRGSPIANWHCRS